MSNARILTAALGLALALPALAAEPAVSPGTKTDMRHRAFRTWTIEVPDEQWFAVSGGIGIPHANGDAFAAGLDGTDLQLDTDGDGELDRTIRATPDDYGVKTARVVLKGEHADGTAFAYGVRLMDNGKGWTWAPGGAMVATVRASSDSLNGSDSRNGAGTTRLAIVDRNGNGRYDDFGEDAMVVGRGNTASLLSRSIHLDGQLWSLDVSCSGTDVTLSPWDGPTAQFDMTTGFKASARLLAAVVRSEDGQHSFDLAPYDKPIAVPAGAYEIVTGRIGLGKQSVQVAAGRAEPITLAEGDATTFNWGGPVAAEFGYVHQDDQVMFHPDAIWYYGAAGEQYSHWNPIGKSPVFTVSDKATGEPLEVLVLPGSC